MIGPLVTAWLDIRARPLRTLAAIAGVVAAVLAVVLVDAAAVLSRRANAEYIATTWGRSATIRIGPSDAGARLRSDTRAEAGRELERRLTGNGVTRVSKSVELGLVLVRGVAPVPTYVTWVSSTYPLVGFVELLAGSFPAQTARSAVAHAVITEELAQRLGFAGADAVGADISFALAEGFVPDLRTTTLHPLVVDAVARSIGSTSYATDAVIVSDLGAPAFARRGGTTWLVHVNPLDARRVIELTGSVKGSAGQPVFDAQRVDQGEALAPVLDQQRVTARAVTVVALLVGGLGILGIGLATVRERGRDFGLRRALGASRNRVFADVIVQTVLEVLLAAVIAIPAAAIVVELIARRLVLAALPLPSSTTLPVASAARGLIAALAVGLIAGILPALRAARASVIQALRD